MAYTATVYTHLDEGVRWILGEINGTTYQFSNSTNSGQTSPSTTGTSIFTAIIASGYSFNRWVYRLGSTTGTVRYSYDNPFVYSGTQNIYIRAETEADSGSGGGTTTTEWTNPQGSAMESIETLTSRSVYLSPYNLYSFPIRTKNSGTLTAYTEGGLDTVGYLTTGLLWDDEEGVPYSIKAENDDDGSGSNFKLTYEVTAGTTYHLWVRCYDPDDSGSVTVVVEPPGGSQVVEGGSMYIYISGQGWKPCTPYVYINGAWKQCEPSAYINGAWRQGT